jgi:hypothetical protein
LRRKSWASHLMQALLREKRMHRNRMMDQMESFVERTGEISSLT